MPMETTPAEAIVTIPADVSTATPPAVAPTATLVPPTPSSSPFPTTAVTPGPAGQCGVLLPVIAGNTEPQTTAFANPDALDAVPAIPAEVRPALEWLLAEPGRVGLVAYRVGEEAEGIYLNPDTAMPLASVVKIIHLVAYAQAVQAGELDPQMVVPLSELARYYLPGSDLGSHNQALFDLQQEERVFGDPPAVRLEDVPRMMIEYSSNAATDYLHFLLGQERIERTALELGMTSQAAPCPFIGQFLTITDANGGVTERDQVQRYIDDPGLYSVDVMNLADRFANDVSFRNAVGTWRGRANGPDITTQNLFSEHLNTRGSARDYANLMARIAENQLGPWEMSVLIRRYLEWPTFFTANQQQMAWTGYKGGSLPGVLTAAYYAQPWWRTRPVVVAIFFHDLPLDVYQQWRRDLPHDELARWLLREPQALPLVRSMLQE